MSPAQILDLYAATAEVTAEDLAAVKATVDRIAAVIEGSHLWADLSHCGHRLDVHIKALTSIATRARRVAESLPEPRPGD